MLVNCAENVPSSPRIATPKASSSVFGSMPVLDLTVGACYTVYALRIWAAVVWYLLADDLYGDGGHYPNFYPSGLFETQDRRFSQFWSVRMDIEERSVLVGTREWIEDEDFFSKLVDGDADARAAFVESKASMDVEFADPAVKAVAKFLSPGFWMCPSCTSLIEDMFHSEMVRCEDCGSLLLAGPKD